NILPRRGKAPAPAPAATTPARPHQRPVAEDEPRPAEADLRFDPPGHREPTPRPAPVPRQAIGEPPQPRSIAPHERAGHPAAPAPRAPRLPAGPRRGRPPPAPGGLGVGRPGRPPAIPPGGALPVRPIGGPDRVGDRPRVLPGRAGIDLTGPIRDLRNADGRPG